MFINGRATFSCHGGPPRTDDELQGVAQSQMKANVEGIQKAQQQPPTWCGGREIVIYKEQWAHSN